MQRKISSFKHPAASSPPPKSPHSPPLPSTARTMHWTCVRKSSTSSARRTPAGIPSQLGRLLTVVILDRETEIGEEAITSSIPISEPSITGTTVNKKKRSYGQSHLELGQSDFLLRTCSTCGIKFAPGDEEDKKSHMTFHKDNTQGIQFKGWAKEMAIQMPSMDGARIISVISSDPSAHRAKVEEVVKMMESELGCGWIYHKFCKVYMFISSQTVAGCLVAEPIKEAFKVVSSAENKENKDPGGKYSLRSKRQGHNKKESSAQSTALRFGNVVFQRQVVRRVHGDSKNAVMDENLTGAMYCESETVEVVCGIRAIWVTPSNRRKRIASHLIDAARSSFCAGLVLEHSQIAFSQVTSAGKALATSYMGSAPLLVYKAETFNISGSFSFSRWLGFSFMHAMVCELCLVGYFSK